jgi:hypothetical protein
MTSSLQDKNIALKARGGKLTSMIEHTKARGNKTSKRKSVEKPMFQPSNQSSIDRIQPVKRRRQMHPGNNAHLHWRDLQLCPYCNHGVKSKVLKCRCVCVNPDQRADLSKHQNQSKKCATKQSDATAAQYVLCERCSEELSTPYGHLHGTTCPRPTPPGS